MSITPIVHSAGPVERGWLGFAFCDPTLERHFREDYCEQVRPVVRRAMLVVSAVFVMFAVLDQFWVPEVAAALLILRFAIVFPFFALCYALTWVPAFRYRIHWLSVAFLSMATGSMVAIFLIVPDMVDFYGFILAAVAVHSCFRLLFVPATLIAGGMTVAYGTACLVGTELSLDSFLYQFFYLLAANALGMFSSYSLEYYLRQNFLNRFLLSQEQGRSERLLLNILPEPIADRLKRDPGNVADHFAEATVLFADLVGFTSLASGLPVDRLVTILNRIFTSFDALTERHGVEKIKTIGDAYMVVAGLPKPRQDHAEAVAALALDMIETMARHRDELGVELTVRIGIHSGPVVAGVIGTKKFLYDLWGDTVNVASRMESHGEPGSIQVSGDTQSILANSFSFGERRTISVKGKGEMDTYLLMGRRENEAG